MEMYRRLCIGTMNTKGLLIHEDELPEEYIKNHNEPAFLSVFKYNDKHLTEFNQTGTVAGITDVVSDNLFWDLDSDDLEKSKADALQLIKRLKEQAVKESSIQIYFSGQKGFTVVVNIDRDLTPLEVRHICVEHFGQGLETLDTGIYNAARILRMPWTKHEKSGLFKIPLTIAALPTLSIPNIKLLAADPKDLEVLGWDTTEFQSSWLKVKSSPLPPKKDVQVLSERLDMSAKPVYLTNCRYYLQNGFFKEGDRSRALICLGATYKNQGFDKAIVYRMLKGVAELQSERENTDRFPDAQIYQNVVMQVYGPTWKNGQFTCREPGNFLYDYCQTLGDHKCNHTKENLTVPPQDVFKSFQEYASNYEKNVLVTGIKSLDAKMKLMVGTSNALVAAPGTGKSSLALQVLNHNSNQGIRSVFYSYDMHSAALYVRMLQRHTGLHQDEIYKIFKTNPKKAQELAEIINREYKNVSFCFKSGQTTDELKETIIDVQNKTSEKVKLVVVDYSELVIANVSDPTAASAQVAQKIREIANDQNVCALTLLQPSKQYANPAEDIVSYNSAKGSSTISQALTVMLGCSRPGFSPKDSITDRFFNITCLKNRNGGLFSLDYKWNGLKGSIDELEDEDRFALTQLRTKREEDKKSQTGGWT